MSDLPDIILIQNSRLPSYQLLWLLLNRLITVRGGEVLGASVVRDM